MNRQDGARPWRDGPLDQSRVEISGGRIDIDEDGRRAAVGDRLGRCGEGVGRSDDFVVRLNSKGQQAEVERRSARTERHTVPRAAKIGEFPLEGFHFLAENEG